MVLKANSVVVENEVKINAAIDEEIADEFRSFVDLGTFQLYSCPHHGIECCRGEISLGKSQIVKQMAAKARETRNETNG